MKKTLEKIQTIVLEQEKLSKQTVRMLRGMIPKWDSSMSPWFTITKIK